ncbi:hypothetical protein P167DRAFT_534164 [Morchella conica CCBAS932]|uniref:Uncharacterized protein n=1 Tax=Morchella conica CCBAS932 TaxID=1392247 RepID=A0A3N4KUR9_9PEZI|nr:hypothetical protein P167DRAFT_534164 [Morchella conica CCBAS932]
MAAPATTTMKDLTGKFWMNKTLSDDTDDVLTLQGISWWTRKGIALANLCLDIKHYRDDDGVEHIDIVQTLTGGIQGTTELRTLDWTEREHEDHIFGKLRGKSRRVKPSGLDDDFLKKNFLPEVETDCAVESYVVNDANKWTAQQIWGFETINDIRYYVRHLKFTKNDTDKVLYKRLVYDWADAQ